MEKLWKCISLVVLWILSCFFLVWCGNKWINKSGLTIDAWWFTLEYLWNIELSKVALKTDDSDEIIDLYQEVWDDVWYKDSLLIAQRYSQWLWIGAFVEENLDVLESHELALSNINKKWVTIEKDWNEINAILLEYEIIEWFIEEIPVLYLSQLFIPDWNTVLLISFMTENSSVRNSVSNAFKKIK